MKEFNYINVYNVMLLMSIVASVSSRALHEDMSTEELFQTFDSAEDVPDYEVLPIRFSHVNKRAVNGHVALELKPFGEHIKLWLEPADGVLFSDETPIYLVGKGRQPGSVAYSYIEDGMKHLAPWIYKNYESYTTLAVNRDGNRIKRMIGVIGSKDMIIRPIPERLVDDVTRRRRSVDNIPESEHDEYHYHIVYQAATTQAAKPLIRSLKSKRSIQDTVYPEILVLVDHRLYKMFEESLHRMVMYLMAFWNGVDMMYTAIENPKYKLHITAVIIAKDDDALEYIEKNRVGNTHVEFNRALEMSQSWLFDHLPNTIPIDSYDVAITMTSLTLCNKAAGSRNCKTGTLGVAYVSGTCRVDMHNRKIIKTGLVHDNGAFIGINTAGHELGHSFGAQHDGVESNTRCSDEQGFIMSALTSTTEDAADWSECTLEEFSRFLEFNGTCLYNKPKFGMKMMRLLPGKMKGPDEQCEAILGTKAGMVDETVCRSLWCAKKDDPYQFESRGPAVDGTPCGPEKLCLHGKCILESSVTY